MLATSCKITRKGWMPYSQIHANNEIPHVLLQLLNRPLPKYSRQIRSAIQSSELLYRRFQPVLDLRELPDVAFAREDMIRGCHEVFQSTCGFVEVLEGYVCDAEFGTALGEEFGEGEADSGRASCYGYDFAFHGLVSMGRGVVGIQ